MKSLITRLDKLEQTLTGGKSRSHQMIKLLADCDKPQLLIMNAQPESDEDLESPDLLEQLRVYDHDGTVYDYERGCYRELTKTEIGDSDEHPKKLTAEEIMSRLVEITAGIEAVT